MRIIGRFVLREIGDDRLLVPVGESMRDHRGLFPLTGVGADVWRLLEKGSDEDAVVSALEELYDAPRDVLEEDVRAFLDELRGCGILAD